MLRKNNELIEIATFSGYGRQHQKSGIVKLSSNLVSALLDFSDSR